jgi:hypothetical protein
VDESSLYLVAKRQMVQVASRLDGAQLRLICPSCPAWSNQDVIAHHIHFLGAVIDGDVPSAVFSAITDTDDAARSAAGTVRDEWTEAGVDERRGRTLDELIAEWDRRIATMPPEVHPVVDATVHLGDVLEALGERRGFDTALVEHSLRVYYDMTLADRIAAAGDSVTLRCVDTGARVGAAPGGPEIAGTAYELLRAIAGRRARPEADDALDWGGAPESTRRLFSAYGWPEH